MRIKPDSPKRHKAVVGEASVAHRAAGLIPGSAGTAQVAMDAATAETWRGLSQPERDLALRLQVGNWQMRFKRAGARKTNISYIDGRKTITITTHEGVSLERQVGPTLGWGSLTKEERDHIGDAEKRFQDAADEANALDFEFRCEIARVADELVFRVDPPASRVPTQKLNDRYGRLKRKIERLKQLPFGERSQTNDGTVFQSTVAHLFTYRGLDTADLLLSVDAGAPTTWMAADLQKVALNLGRVAQLLRDLSVIHPGKRGKPQNVATRTLLAWADTVGVSRAELADVVVSMVGSWVEAIPRKPMSTSGFSDEQLQQHRREVVLHHFDDIGQSKQRTRTGK